LAAFRDSKIQPSPETKARFQEELQLMHKHEDWKQYLAIGLFIAANAVWIYYYFRGGKSPNKSPKPTRSNGLNSRNCMNNELEKELTEFFRWFDEVFHRDWRYTKSMLGIREATEEDCKKMESIFGECEVIHNVAPDGTFLDPRVDDPGEDWGHRGLLLASYKRLLPLLKKHGIAPGSSNENAERH
jgi:hypothetical protein